MTPDIPAYIDIVFILTTILATLFFYFAANRSRIVLLILLLWMAIQAKISLSGFYTVTNTIPPRLILMPFPPLVFIIVLFLSSKGKQFIDSLNIRRLTLLHIVRIPVEIVLFWIAGNKLIPELMTFEGRNFDILSGITAPFIYYFGFVKNKLSKRVLLAWNFICLGLLFNIVINAATSAPSPIQLQAFDQPNIGVLYFPFNWLPSVVVPIVLLSHLATIRQLIKTKS
jgi:hypothetical protein